MPKILKLEYENPRTHAKSSGRIEIKNQTVGSADLYFYGDICSSTWDLWQQEDMCPQDVADFLNGLNSTQNINVYINSGGGDSFAGLAIYNILRRNSAKKTVYVDGLAASAASVIAMVGAFDGNQLIMPPGAQLMIHNAWTIAIGNAADLRQVADALDKTSQSYAEAYTEHAVEGITQEQIQAMMDAEKWMTGTEASQIFKNVQVQGEQIAASLDSGFSNRYKNVPQSLVKQPPVPPKPKEPAPEDSKQIDLAKSRAHAILEMS